MTFAESSEVAVRVSINYSPPEELDGLHFNELFQVLFVWMVSKDLLEVLRDWITLFERSVVNKFVKDFFITFIEVQRNLIVNVTTSELKSLSEEGLCLFSLSLLDPVVIFLVINLEEFVFD